jgi:carbamoyl-phosphate synthase small subunit
VALFDYGAKGNIRRELLKRGVDVVTLEAHETCENALRLGVHGVMLSNGPGDPAVNTRIIGEIEKLMAQGIPVFGICLGHQLMALAAGARTEKLKYGHRGANQPVKELATGRVFITCQNHGYAVVSDTLPRGARLSFVNANDNTCEGIEYTEFPGFSVQFHPEASSGPLDTAFLFDRFIGMM